MRNLVFRCLSCVAPLVIFAVSPATVGAPDWSMALEGEHRKEGNAGRNAFRHPRETLEFFGFREDMTVVELSPGGGWYTEVLAPLLHERGQYYAAHYGVNGRSYYRRALGNYLRKLGENDDVYGRVTITTLGGDSSSIAPAGSADLVLAFRNIHSWLGSDSLPQTMEQAFDALKPGGVLGVVQHRAKDGRDLEKMKSTGYVTEQAVIDAAAQAGFVLDARSEINANPKDKGDYEGGVWELPPSLRGDESTRDERIAVGESDRMTLRFVKPE
ncbi:MAG: methyltransferase [Pseudomonadota bacterium]